MTNIINKITINTELISKKNSKQIIRLRDGRTMLISSPQAQKAHKELNELLFEHKPEWDEMVEGKTFPYKLHIFIYRKTHRRFDYINIVQGLFDSMQEIDYLPDDDATHIIPVFEGFDVDKEYPRFEMWVE